MSAPIDPHHYTSRRIEPIEVIEAWELGFHLGSAVKYIGRCEFTNKRSEDLLKAANYCFREATGLWLPRERIRTYLIESGAAE